MVDQKLADYVKASVVGGKTREEIYKELLAQGFTIEMIQESFTSFTAHEEKDALSRRTIYIIVTIGAILVGAGIFSFIAANWQEMDRPVKVGIILLSMLISYGAGWYVKEKANLPKTGDALILLGAIIYGAGIFLVAQMFNIRANWPDGFILWMIGAVVMALSIESNMLFRLSVLLGIVALIGHPFGIVVGLGYNPFLLTSSFLLLIGAVVTFISGWVIRKKIPPQLKEFY